MQRKEAERVDLLTTADGDGAEDLTEEMKRELQKEFMSSDSDEEGPAQYNVTKEPELTTVEAETRQPRRRWAETSSEEESEREEFLARRNRRLRRHKTMNRNLRRRTNPCGSAGPGS